MAISSVDIANFALSHIGKSRIESFAEESAEAKEVSLWYDQSRQQALSANDWSFARKQQVLALTSEDPPFGWSYRYQYPADCLRFRIIVNPLGETADAVPYCVVSNNAGNNKTIISNLEDACGEYTFDQTTPALYSLFFIDFLSIVLASRLAFPLTGKTSLTERMRGESRAMAAIAPAQDANEAVSAPPREAEAIRGRT